jgi:NAD(P)-dependent dehydrogenase (short-subunit alcohol dehydrogenase family)
MPTVGIVTGAGRGMGAACVARLASSVDVMLLVDRDAAAAVAAAESLSLSGHDVSPKAFPLDVTDEIGLHGLAEHVQELGTLRGFVHAAGVSPSMADGREILQVDLVATARLIEVLLPAVVRGTAGVCFASIAALLLPDLEPDVDAILDSPLAPDFLDRLASAAGPALDHPGLAYAYAKRGVLRLMQREAIRFGQRGARICSVSPGIIDTPMGRQEAAAQPINDYLVQQTPLGREGTPDEVASVVAFLLSDEASFVNGVDVRVDGGVVAALRQGQSHRNETTSPNRRPSTVRSTSDSPHR